MGTAEDEIAETVLTAYDSLPAKCKPVKATAEFFQWVPLSGIVATKGDDSKPRCLALGTGMKCLPIDQVSQANGSILHDWHAEIVALRAFNHFLLQECLKLLLSPFEPSFLVRRRDAQEISEQSGLQPFSIRNDLQLHMYSSEAPCGDASMELLMQAQADPTPWPVDPRTKELEGSLRGRESFAELGVVRRKPARADSPQTLSKSCSDKLALKQCTSILSSCTSLLVNPANAYIESVILPQSQYIEYACIRSFGRQGRLKPVSDQHWSGGYRFQPFEVRTTDREFKYSRRNKPASSKELRTSNVTAVYHPHLQEALVGGRLQGRRKPDPRGASAICSRRMWTTALQVLAALGTPRLLQQVSESSRVRKWKESSLFKDRRQVKDDVRSKALQGWVRNEGDDFELNVGETTD
ncbi:MAG: hypothetical protein Q9219_001304 [cf. Caloplaca sp. 3 TL-2023]